MRPRGDVSHRLIDPNVGDGSSRHIGNWQQEQNDDSSEDAKFHRRHASPVGR
jgi:hypothetical protein